MDEILIWYEHEVETLRNRVRQQNIDIVSLTKQIEIRYQLYTQLEEDFNSLKTEYEKFKTQCILQHAQHSPKDAVDPSSPPPLDL